MSTCLTLADFERYDAGMADEAVARMVRQHLASCDACRVTYERYRADQAFLAGVKSALGSGSGFDAASSSSFAEGARGRLSRVPRIEGYRIIGVLGQGGMGIVYRAVQTKLNRTVALKVLPAMVGAASPAAVARFRREATAAARLHHTNIVPIYDFGESQDAYYYAMELIAGQPLNVLIKQFADNNAAVASPARLTELLGSLTSEEGEVFSAYEPAGSSADDSPSMTSATFGGRGRLYYRQVARWIADAADALHYAHGQGIIHRDIKPANLILSAGLRILIADFGLAKSADEESVTMTGSLLGTVRYLSPEQAMARRVAVDHRTDIYSLGATMYELLCFQPAFPGTDDKQVLSAIITHDPTPPRKIAPGVPHELETICLKTLEKSPEQRYATARAFADDLRRYTQDLPIVAKRPGPVARAVKFVRRQKVPVIAAAIILVLAASGSIVVKIERERRRRAVALEELATVDSLVTLAKAKHDARDWAGARADFEQALRIDPEDVPALGNFARMLKDQYNYESYGDRSVLEEAMAYLDRALALDETYPLLHNTKGVLLKMLGRFDEALEFYRNETGRNPQEDAAWENLAAVYALSGDLAAAERNMRHAAALVGSNKLKSCYTSWRSLASLLLYQGNPEAARAIVHALDCASSDPWSLLIAARIRLQLATTRDYDQALRDADFAYKGRDRHGVAFGRYVRRVLALAHLRNERWASAARYARDAISAGDIQTVNLFTLAIAQMKQRHGDEARRSFDRAVDHWPEDLTGPEDFRVRAPEGVLWFETAADMLRLRQEARALFTADGGL